MKWLCTGESRWVVRHFSEPYEDTWNIHIDEHGMVETERRWSVQVLQQKWAMATYDAYGTAFPTETIEWRDVPTVKEN